MFKSEYEMWRINSSFGVNKNVNNIASRFNAENKPKR